ncbi:MAG: hypothetical protein ABMA14_17430 [Hyphomonadaceae bacterium]
MRTSFTPFALATAFLFLMPVNAAPAVAQEVTAQEQAALAGPWRGVWTRKNSEYEYQAELRFAAPVQGKITGEIRWMLVQSPQAEEQNKIGMRGTEYLEGKYDARAHVADVAGVRLDDPNNILGTDTYRFMMSLDGLQVIGLSLTNDRNWTGRLDLARVDPKQ